MSLFYRGTSENISYQSLIDSINASDVFYVEYKASSFVSFCINLLTGIINQKNIVLVDLESPGEIENPQPLKNEVKIKNAAELIEKVMASTSEIGIYSSGSEGPPKLIYQPIARLAKSVRVEERYRDRSWGFTYNPAHSAGIQVLLQVLANSGTLVDLHLTRRKDIIAQMTSSGLDYISGTPTFYRMLAPFDFEIPSVKSVTLNGEKSTMALIDHMKQVFPNARIRNIYGSTEAGPLMSSETDVFTVPERLMGKLKVEDDQLYFHNSIVSNSVGKSEWYPSGDLVELVETSPMMLRFISRKSRIINVGGHNVNPQHIEEALLTIEGIRDARVFGKENALIGNLLEAEVVVMEDYTYTEKDLMDALRLKFPPYKVPRIIRFVTAIKTGRTGKKLM